jgi:hypothetical protein
MNIYTPPIYLPFNILTFYMLYTHVLCVHDVQFYTFLIFNTVFEKLLTLGPKLIDFEYVFSNTWQYIYIHVIYIHLIMVDHEQNM